MYVFNEKYEGQGQIHLDNNLCCNPLLEPSCQEGSIEGSQHMHFVEEIQKSSQNF